MKKTCFFLILFSLAICFSANVNAQCAMCTKTAQQLGEKPAQGMNAGILYLMAVPYCIVGFIGYRWWKAHQNNAI
jgi:hypothetical protein